MRNSPILCLGLTPAIQRTLEFERFELDEVNRARSSRVSVAGKAVNVARVLHTLGRQPVLTGFNGGLTGRQLLGLLRAEGLASAFVDVPPPTRTCTTILDRAGGQVTELVEEAVLPGPAAWRRLERVIERALRRAACAAISGNLPPGAPAAFYAWVAGRAARLGVPLVIDSSQAPLLSALPHRPLLVKCNERELAATCGAARLTPRGVLRQARALQARGAQNVLVTAGARGLTLVGPDQAWRLAPPRIEPVNPIGSGDAVTAGLIHGLLAGRSLPESARLGAACGTANALTLLPGEIRMVDVRRLLRQIHVVPVR